jgi:hypothetical protein
MNCGSSETYSTAILGLSRLVTRPMTNNRRGECGASGCATNSDRFPGTYGLPRQPEQVAGAEQPDHVVQERHDREQRGNPRGRPKEVGHEARRDAQQRHEAGRPPLCQRPGDQVDHVRPGCQHQADRPQRDPDHRRGADHLRPPTIDLLPVAAVPTRANPVSRLIVRMCYSSALCGSIRVGCGDGMAGQVVGRRPVDRDMRTRT